MTEGISAPLPPRAHHVRGERSTNVPICIALASARASSAPPTRAVRHRTPTSPGMGGDVITCRADDARGAHALQPGPTFRPSHGGIPQRTAQSHLTGGVCHATLHSSAPAFPTPVRSKRRRNSKINMLLVAWSRCLMQCSACCTRRGDAPRRRWPRCVGGRPRSHSQHAPDALGAGATMVRCCCSTA